MSKEDFITGKTEKHLLERLKKEGKLTIVEIYGHYSSETLARNFINKLITLEIAESIGIGIIGYKEGEHGQTNKDNPDNK